MDPRWVQLPSRDLCVTQCGGACCRAPGSVLLTRAEVERLAKRSASDLILYDEGGDQHRLNFSDHQGRCPMLQWNSECRIYEDRPAACRAYPSRPDPRCAVWPA